MAWSLAKLFPDSQESVEQVTELPPIPQVAQALLQLKDDPRADAKRLGALIALDPSLTAQIIRYANSAFFNYQGKLDSIQDAVSRVLGFDRAMHIAIGLAAGQSLKHDVSGPLGVREFWMHAVFSATLMQDLAKQIPAEKRPSIGLTYLCGLLHDIGYLLLGHLLEPEFKALNDAVAREPHRSIVDIENEVIGMTHCELGLGLLRSWKMPNEVLTTVMQHHNESYKGVDATYANLALIADRALKRFEVEDADDGELPGVVLKQLGLDEMCILELTEDLLVKNDEQGAFVQMIVGS